MLTLPLLLTTTVLSTAVPPEALPAPESTGTRIGRTAAASATGLAFAAAAVGLGSQLGCGPPRQATPIGTLTGLDFAGATLNALGCMWRGLGVGAGVGALSLLAMGSPAAVHRLMGGRGRGWVGLVSGLAGAAVAAGPSAFMLNDRGSPTPVRLGVGLSGLVVAALLPAVAMEVDSGLREASRPSAVENLTVKFSPTAGGMALSVSGDF